MQQKLCLWLAVAVLFGALVAGNPFLGERVQRRARPAAPPVTPEPHGPASHVPPTNRVLATDLRAVGSPVGHGAAANPRAEATPALAVALNAPAPADASAVPLCPDRALRPLVVDVERTARGEPVWVLRDGHRVMRNPKRGTGEPLLIPVAATTAKSK